jgi:hypothetical protein
MNAVGDAFNAIRLNLDALNAKRKALIVQDRAFAFASAMDSPLAVSEKIGPARY